MQVLRPIVNANFVCAGRPDLVTALAGIVATDVATFTQWRQKNIPSGNNWEAVAQVVIYNGTSGTGGHVIQDEGTSLPQRKFLNFMGAHVLAYDNPSANTTELEFSGNVDGGHASSSYLPTQSVNGGGA